MLAQKVNRNILFAPDICSEIEARKLSKSAELIEIKLQFFKISLSGYVEGILAVAKQNRCN
jgi:TrmH family RNA methyltransferase